VKELIDALADTVYLLKDREEVAGFFPDPSKEDVFPPQENITIPCNAPQYRCASA